jgi:hypothetical protein
LNVLVLLTLFFRCISLLLVIFLQYADLNLHMTTAELPTPVQKQRRAQREYIASLTLGDIAQYFHLPIREASRTLRIGLSILKKKCRQYGIPRWPHRKIKSLDSLIQDLEVNMTALSVRLSLITREYISCSPPQCDIALTC